MLAWFGQELAKQSRGKQHHSTTAAAGGSLNNSALQSIAGSVMVPMAAAGLQAAALAAAGDSPHSGNEQHAGGPAAESEAVLSGAELAAAFQQWVTAAGSQLQVDFRVKS
jgi:hypothetical protein